MTGDRSQKDDACRRLMIPLPASKPDGVWIREGETMAGWQVMRITEEAVTVEKSGRSFELLLYENTPGRMTVPEEPARP